LPNRVRRSAERDRVEREEGDEMQTPDWGALEAVDGIRLSWYARATDSSEWGRDHHRLYPRSAPTVAAAQSASSTSRASVAPLRI